MEKILDDENNALRELLPNKLNRTLRQSRYLINFI